MFSEKNIVANFSDIGALFVLNDGKNAQEGYFKGAVPEELRISWSLAKSFLSALIGIVGADGDIASVDDPVTKYAITLIGSAYQGATIRNDLIWPAALLLTRITCRTAPTSTK
ncbi:MAG: hypothetical protein JKY41_00765 [Rhodobacteraceae bacterium]|nr:hypothetical protein [Paracoccaceae bacterium]